jgi:hypothetical protein
MNGTTPDNSNNLDLSTLLPKNISPFLQSPERILFKSEQKTFGEAIAADIYDDLIGLIPLLGDLVGSGPRVVDAISDENILATAVHGVDLGLGLIPYPFGEILDIIVPANTILKAIKYVECLNKDSELNCAYPQGSIERLLIERV